MSAPGPFSKVLVANRGEIACRVIAACRELGLKAVAVYSEVDRDALHVRLADEAICLGPAEPQASYLDVEKLVRAALASGAGAVHPGYGFRAESAELAEACASEQLVFIGPRPETLRQMGDKRAARALAREAGVPVVPGHEGSTSDPEAIAKAARAVGYPLLVKAALGGGGKGMRRVSDEAGLAEALESAARLAGGAFGDASVYLERYLPGARHIEVQVLGDGEGEAIQLFERECSLQRRHQKVIEEAPAARLAPELAARIRDAAVALARRARYLSAGTCEFLVAPDGSFYFLEMNTRIQVEHPVTEAVTGVDLVRQQLKLALGARLPEQGSITLRGHAIEARLTAEDVGQGFLPQAGRLVRFDVPRYPFLRLDTGFEAGASIPVEYDSLLAKLIVWGEDRETALARLAVALEGTIVHGVRTNLQLLRFLLAAPEVREGVLTTELLEAELVPRYLERLRAPAPPALLAAAALAEHLRAPRAPARGEAVRRPSPFVTLGRYRMGGERS